jgi:hypothetical protein
MMPAFSPVSLAGRIFVPMRKTLDLIAAAVLWVVATSLPAQTPQAATPTFSIAPGSYPGAQTVSISDTTPGAVIYYSTNGATPNTNPAYPLGAV